MRHLDRVNRRRGRRENGALESFHTRLDGCRFCRRYLIQLYAVHPTTAQQLIESGKLFLVLGDDDLPAAIDSQPALETIGGKRGVPFLREFCLETVSRVVEAGVKDPAVPS